MSSGTLPTEDETLCLKACVLAPGEAVAAWESWRERHTLKALETAEFSLLPLLYQNLQRAGYDTPEMTTLKGIYQQNWYGNQQAVRALQSVAQGFNASGIPMLVLKAAALDGLYPAPHTRPIHALDILVPEGKPDQVIAMLQQAGWRLKRPLSSRARKAFNAWPLINGNGLTLYLHWHLLKECCHDGDDNIFWKRAVPFAIHQEKTLTLSPTDHLLHSCIAGHQWSRQRSMLWLADAWMILKSGHIEWDYLMGEVRQRQLSLRVGEALEFLGKLGADIPGEVTVDLRTNPVSPFERYEHGIVNPAADPRRSLFWPLKKARCRQQRLYPGQSPPMRVFTFPMIMCHELALHSPWELPGRVATRAWDSLRMKTHAV